MPLLSQITKFLSSLNDISIIRRYIIEAVDSICRDGDLPNADFYISFFRHTTCSVSASVHYNSLKYKATVIVEILTQIVYYLLLLLLLPLLLLLLPLSSSVQTAYHKTGVCNCSISLMKIIYTGAYMILDAQNLHTFS